MSVKSFRVRRTKKTYSELLKAAAEKHPKLYKSYLKKKKGSLKRKKVL